MTKIRWYTLYNLDNKVLDSPPIRIWITSKNVFRNPDEKAQYSKKLVAEFIVAVMIAQEFRFISIPNARDCKRQKGRNLKSWKERAMYSQFTILGNRTKLWFVTIMLVGSQLHAL